MPRKTKRPAVLIEEGVESVETLKSVESAESASVKVEDVGMEVNGGGAESVKAAENVETKPVKATKSKKLRRPTLSDTVPAIPVAAFNRLVREVGDSCRIDMRWEGEALQALQVDTEAYLIGNFQKAKRTLGLFGKGHTMKGGMLRA
jgi:histone H3/H4